jgi:serine/threonine-protein kinase
VVTAEANVPSRFGRFALHELVQRDLVSATYRASIEPGSGEPHLHQQVALRIADDGLARHERAAEGFLRANRRVAALDHAHLLRVVDVGRAEGLPYVATMWRDGVALGDLLDGPHVPVWAALRMAGQLAEALDTVHEHQLVHGTVGMRTVWVKHRRRDQHAASALLTGFGTGYLLASLLQRAEDPGDVTDVLCVAPEQLLGEVAEPATDQYALACLLYTLLTGTPPFPGDTAQDVFAGHLDLAPPRATDGRGDLDPAWNDVFDRALAKRPSQRFDNCRMLVRAAADCTPPRDEELRQTSAAAWMPRTMRPPEPDPFPHAPIVEEPDERPRRRHVVVMMAIATLLVAVLTVVAVRAGVLSNASAGPPPPQSWRALAVQPPEPPGQPVGPVTSDHVRSGVRHPSAR